VEATKLYTVWTCKVKWKNKGRNHAPLPKKTHTKFAFGGYDPKCLAPAAPKACRWPANQTDTTVMALTHRGRTGTLARVPRWIGPRGPPSQPHDLAGQRIKILVRVNSSLEASKHASTPVRVSASPDETPVFNGKPTGAIKGGKWRTCYSPRSFCLLHSKRRPIAHNTAPP
jgi:hypothetical protein